MALVPVDPGGRSGPYWRRQQRRTLPGERTGAELAAINALLMKMGQPLLGGPSQRSAIPEGQPPGIGPSFGQGINEAHFAAPTSRPVAPPPNPAIAALLARLVASQQPRRAQPAQPAILPQLQHRVVQVRPHTRLISPRPAY